MKSTYSDNATRIIHNNKISSAFYSITLVFICLNGPTIAQVNAQEIINDMLDKPQLTFNQLGEQLNQSNSSKMPGDDIHTYEYYCAAEIEVDPSSSRYKKESVDCVAGLINTCKIGEVNLLYATGSMYLKIVGLKNGSCQMDIVHEIERDSNQYSCVVPVSKLSTWGSWKNGDGFDAVGDVLSSCSQK